MEPELKSSPIGNNEKIELNATVEQLTKFLALTTTGAATIAIAFDVGYFSRLDINMFTLFSLSEHILFSLEALPIAMILSLVIIISYTPAKRIMTRFINASDDKKKTRKLILKTIIITTATVINIIAAIYIDILFIIFLFIPVFFVVMFTIGINLVTFYLFFYILSFTEAYVQGALIAQKYTSYDAEALHQITTKDHNNAWRTVDKIGGEGATFFRYGEEAGRFSPLGEH